MHMPERQQMPSVPIVQILQDTDGFMWYATDGEGLYCDDGYETCIYGVDDTQNEKLPDAHITALALDRQGRIWFGTNNGAYILNRSDGTIRLLEDTEGEKVNCIFQRKNGEIWIGLLGVALRYTDADEFINSYPLTYEGMPATALSMVEDAMHHLCISFEEGILCAFDDIRDEMLLVDWPFSKAPSAMAMDSRHHCLWIGTWGLGIVKFDAQNAFTRQFDTLAGEGVDSEQSFIYDIKYDKANSLLWATTQKGLYAYQISDGELCPMDSGVYLPKETEKTTTDTIPKHLAIDRLGRVWFIDEFGKINIVAESSTADKIAKNSIKAIPTVVKVSFDEIEKKSPKDRVEIPSGTRKVTVYLSTFDFVNTASICYSYRLKGTDEWTDLKTGDNRVELNGPFEAGSYVLLVRVGDGKGTWSKENVCITLQVGGGSWASLNLFLLLLALLLTVAISYIGIRYRHLIWKKGLKSLREETERSTEPKELATSTISEQIGPSPSIQPTEQASNLPTSEQKPPRNREAKDKLFLRQLNKILNKHIAETDFNVEKVSAEMNISRMSLYRHVQALTEMNPAEYFRHVRLERAADLLRTTNLPIATISARTGFATPRTFSKSFKEKYGLSPSEFREKI